MIEDYGRRLLPSILHHEADKNPQRTFALVARSDNVEHGFDSVTYRRVADATDYVTKWLLDRFEDGGQPTNHPTLAYVGPNDLRYNILFYGAIQCRYKVFLPSPRNPVSVNISLLDQTACARLVYTAELTSVTKLLQSAGNAPSIQYEQLPSLQELLAAPSPGFLYNLAYADVYRESILILHSSGSTGTLKPVVSTHGTFATIDVRDFPTVPGRRNQEFATTWLFPESESYMYDTFPPFHLSGFVARVIVPVLIGTTPIFDPPSRPPSGSLAAKTIRSCRPRGVYFPPVIIEQLFKEPDSEDLFRKLDFVFYSGGPLSPSTGSQISDWTQLCQFYGSTEVGQFRLLTPRPDDWAYLEFHPHEAFELRRVAEEEDNKLYELVLSTDKKHERTSAICHNYPDLPEWRTKDLFEQHPNRPNLWKFHARTDDILVFSSGEKLNPLPLESHLSSVSGLKGALVVGTRRAQPALLLELDEEHTSVDALQKYWSSIDEANRLLPGHGRITRSMVVVASPDKPFKRAPKGTIVRAQTEKLYADEISRLYDGTSEKAEVKPLSLTQSGFRNEDMKQLLGSVLSRVGIDGPMEDDWNLYEHGLDSVKTADIVSLLKASLRPHKPAEKLRWLSLETIYLNPTIDKLAHILLGFLNDDETPNKQDSVEEVKAKITQYTSIIHNSRVENNSTLPNGQSVNGTSDGNQSGKFSIAITGTTGFFGQYLLSRLVACTSISRIYCLNRSPTAQENFAKLGRKHDKDLVFLRMNITSPRLGLSDDDYALLLKNCSLIVHNAWQVDFNLPLESFGVHLEGMRRIIEFCAESTLRTRFVFVSSIASTGVYAPAKQPVQTVPEAMTSADDIAQGLDIGYAKSKFVAEHILDQAASKLAIPATILRLGHILPATIVANNWPTNDSLVLFLQTSKKVANLARDFLDDINWLPVDIGADIIFDVVQHTLLADDRNKPGTQVFNIVNPGERPWSSITKVLTSWCGTDTTLISMSEWVEKLHGNDTGDVDTLSKFPALRILHFFDLWVQRGQLHKYATEKSSAISKSLRALKAPDDGLIDEWLRLL